MATQRCIPDVPEDIIVHYAHLNDPNYTFDTVDWPEDSFELNDKMSPIESSLSRRKLYEYDAETRSQTQSDYSRSSSHIATSRAPLQSEELVPFDYDDESPYPEVRAAVPTTDDPSMPVNTFRMWFLGLTFSIVLSGVNQFFNSRLPSVFITALTIQLLALPAGKALEYALPTRKFRFRIPFTAKSWVGSLNPGPFNIKEHVLITIMANVTANGAYATDVIMTQRLFYNMPTPASYQLLLTLGSQLLGFGLAGLGRRFLVWPAAMIWPGALVNCALFTTLHKHYGRKEKKHISRQRFFFYVFAIAFAWYWLPGYLFTALSVFNWVCWIAPQNKVVNTLFGTQTGLGMGILTFDWSMITFIGSPLVTPWWAQANIIVSLFLWFWLIAPILYFGNIFYAKFMPISAALSFDNTGAPYQATNVVVNGVFQPELYQQYSPIYLPTTFVISYGLQFASFTATIVHVFLWYRKDIARQFRHSLRQERDIHARLMCAYLEVPEWWYVLLGIVAFVVGLVVIEVFNTQLPVWAYILSILVSTLFMIPGGIIQAVTNQSVTLNVISEVIGGFLMPGRPIALMIYKTYGTTTVSQALAFTGDLKLGHYMKIPPRLMFSAQVIATIVSCFVVTGVQAWQFENIVDFCEPTNQDKFTCPNLQVFNTASIIWGSIGAKRVFGSEGLWFFLIGALLPIPFYFAARRWPQSLFKFVNMPVFFAGTAVMPPATGINLASWALVGFVFMYWIRRRHFRWWMRFNYILSAALDSSVAFGIMVIFLSLQLPKGGINLNWWGNTAWQNTRDAMGMPFLTLAPNQTFGPQVVCPSF
ncbi:OPT oligopeptide transporter [Ramaria rubella]|nr:OPT oligopeptide transporter [Ramaria rubella]